MCIRPPSIHCSPSLKVFSSPLKTEMHVLPGSIQNISIQLQCCLIMSYCCNNFSVDLLKLIHPKCIDLFLIVFKRIHIFSFFQRYSAAGGIAYILPFVS